MAKPHLCLIPTVHLSHISTHTTKYYWRKTELHILVMLLSNSTVLALSIYYPALSISISYFFFLFKFPNLLAIIILPWWSYLLLCWQYRSKLKRIFFSFYHYIYPFTYSLLCALSFFPITKNKLFKFLAKFNLFTFLLDPIPHSPESTFVSPLDYSYKHTNILQYRPHSWKLWQQLSSD